jgi:hypothetical protein
MKPLLIMGVSWSASLFMAPGDAAGPKLERYNPKKGNSEGDVFRLSEKT